MGQIPRVAESCIRRPVARPAWSFSAHSVRTDRTRQPVFNRTEKGTGTFYFPSAKEKLPFVCPSPLIRSSRTDRPRRRPAGGSVRDSADNLGRLLKAESEDVRLGAARAILELAGKLMDPETTTTTTVEVEPPAPMWLDFEELTTEEMRTFELRRKLRMASPAATVKTNEREPGVALAQQTIKGGSTGNCVPEE
jgi:hypothetical protein